MVVQRGAAGHVGGPRQCWGSLRAALHEGSKWEQPEQLGGSAAGSSGRHLTVVFICVLAVMLHKGASREQGKQKNGGGRERVGVES